MISEAAPGSELVNQRDLTEDFLSPWNIVLRSSDRCRRVIKVIVVSNEPGISLVEYFFYLYFLIIDFEFGCYCGKNIF